MMILNSGLLFWATMYITFIYHKGVQQIQKWWISRVWWKVVGSGPRNWAEIIYAYAQ